MCVHIQMSYLFILQKLSIRLYFTISHYFTKILKTCQIMCKKTVQRKHVADEADRVKIKDTMTKWTVQ